MALVPFKGQRPNISPSAFVEASARVIGDVVLGAESSIWFNAVIRGDINFIRIGERSNIQDGAVIHVTRESHPVIIGNEVTVGHNATLHSCTVGDRCLVGIGAIVLDGAVLGEGSMIAAGTVIAPGTLVPPRTLVVGSPGRPLRELTEAEIDRLSRTVENYLRLRILYMQNVDERGIFDAD